MSMNCDNVFTKSLLAFVSFAYGVLRRFLAEEKVEAVKGLTLTAEGSGVVFDVPAEDLDTYLAGKDKASSVRLEVLTALPRLQEKDQSRGGRFGSGGPRRGGFGDRSVGSRFLGGRGGSGRNVRFSSDRFSNNGGIGRGRGIRSGKRW